MKLLMLLSTVVKEGISSRFILNISDWVKVQTYLTDSISSRRIRGLNDVLSGAGTGKVIIYMLNE